MTIRDLEPKLVWEQFDDITRVPRPSKKEGRIIEFLVDFAKKHNLDYRKDAIGNVVIRKEWSSISRKMRYVHASTATGFGLKVRHSVPTAV